MRLPFVMIFIWLLALPGAVESAQVQLGVDRLFSTEYRAVLRGKRIGLITNQTGVNSKLQSTITLFKSHAKSDGFTLKALFAPEHGLMGHQYAAEDVEHAQDADGIPIYSLHGSTRRPTKEMLQNVDILVYDIQDIGSRSYTFISTLFYVMEEAAKLNIPVIVLDRPNPINGLVVDGPMLEEKWRSIVGYINVPYCHGMTIGELARFFNDEYRVGCALTVVPMKGWKREMSWKETGLSWIPTSPNIPEATTALYYPMTGLLGELQFINIGVGYTLPFRIIGAPWIKGTSLAQQLNAQHFPGIFFYPFHFRPFFGRFSGQDCEGVLILVTDPKIYKPVSTQYLILGMLKSLYPVEFKKIFETSAQQKEMFNKVNGTAEIFRLLKEEKYVVWKLKEFQEGQRSAFLNKRKKYLITDYQ